MLLKLDAAGEVVFSRSVPFYERILLDPSGGMFVAGGGGLAKFDEGGTELWSVDFEPLAGSVSNITVEDIVLSPNGTVAIVGSTYTPVDFGTGPIPHAGRDDIFVATFNPRGHRFIARSGGARSGGSIAPLARAALAHDLAASAA